MSTPLFDKLRAEGHGASFQCPLSGKIVAFVGYGFVDDVDLISANSVNWRATAAKMQAAVDSWEAALRATGGALVPDKSHWFLISFEWNGGEWHYSKVAETPSQIHVRNLSGDMEVLEHHEVSHAERTLGARLAPDSNNATKFEYLLEKNYPVG